VWFFYYKEGGYIRIKWGGQGKKKIQDKLLSTSVIENIIVSGC